MSGASADELAAPRETDYLILGVRLCYAFKWSVEYVFNLTFPLFMALSSKLESLRADETIDTVFSGYTAGKYGGGCLDRLFERKCKFVKVKNEAVKFDFTTEELRAATARALEAQRIAVEMKNKNQRGK